MWPGCSTSFNGDRPTYNVDFNDHNTIDEKVSQVFDWLDFPVQERPQFIGMYVQQVDQAGHAYGPYANEVILSIIENSVSMLIIHHKPDNGRFGHSGYWYWQATRWFEGQELDRHC
jgi:predicted AlkP superfamily pyrophosphatase or phosphodiesterase